MDRLPDRDSRHPRDNLMTISDLPTKRRCPGRPVTDSVPRSGALNTPLKANKIAKQPLAKRQGRPLIQTVQSQKRPRGRPAVTISTGMVRDTFNKKCKQLDNAIRALKKSMDCSSFRGNTLTIRI